MGKSFWFLSLFSENAFYNNNRKQVKNTKQLKKKDQKYEAIYRDIEDTFKGFFGTPVKLNAGKRKGKIIIEYSSNEDLERIMDLIK